MRKGDATLEGVDFKRVISRTATIIGKTNFWGNTSFSLSTDFHGLEQAAIQIQPAFARPNYVSVRKYIQFLIQRNIIDEQLGQVYVEGYERARFGQARVSRDEYLVIMKHLAAMLHQMGYGLHTGLESQRQGPESAASRLSCQSRRQFKRLSPQRTVNQDQHRKGTEYDDNDNDFNESESATSRLSRHSCQQYPPTVAQRTVARAQHRNGPEYNNNNFYNDDSEYDKGDNYDNDKNNDYDDDNDNHDPQMLDSMHSWLMMGTNRSRFPEAAL